MQHEHEDQHEDDPYAVTWQDQLIELDLPGVGPITACGDPALFAAPGTGGGPWDANPETGGPADEAPAVEAPADEAPEETAFRRRRPTTPPPRRTVRTTLSGREPLELERTWLVVPALGPVLSSADALGTVVADLSGREAPLEVRPIRGEPPAAPPSREGARAGAPLDGPAGGGARPVRSRDVGWFRRPAIAAALRRRGGMVATGALVGPRREWFEPAVAAREDLLAAHPDQALERVLRVAVDHGQVAVLRIGPGGLDVVPTGADPRVPMLSGLELLVTARPSPCPLQGKDDCAPCRPHGGPWVRSAQAAQLDWEARRAQALAVQSCGVCFGEALPPEADQPQVPRLGRRAAVTEINRLHLRGGEVVRIDPIAPPR
ncbi:hypothetical protein [Brachybacterium fresconis]|uniref:Uncharacterized protein n=1 Tax=Brachybacterium fresconis TaxID=173363 RepID=A0ABS4YMN1_9MICO|nr:hypothetical protein [Brachybacterium fresconis]MBP2410018.1 hypothetical protein [Brachybacterium fresconis]